MFFVSDFSSQGGISNTCKSLGFGESFEINLAREHKSTHGAINYAINTDFHIKIELKEILLGRDKLLGIKQIYSFHGLPCSHHFIVELFQYIQKGSFGSKLNLL